MYILSSGIQILQIGYAYVLECTNQIRIEALLALLLYIIYILFL